MLREKLIALNAYIMKKERSEINNLSFYLKKQEKESKLNSNQEDTIKIKADSSKTENRI